MGGLETGQASGSPGNPADQGIFSRYRLCLCVFCHEYEWYILIINIIFNGILQQLVNVSLLLTPTIFIGHMASPFLRYSVTLPSSRFRTNLD
jgi:hypothetical protein